MAEVPDRRHASRIETVVEALLFDAAAFATSVEESNRGDVPSLDLAGGGSSQDELGVEDEAGLGSLRQARQALELILAAALDGRRGSMEPEEVLDILIDRVREMLDEDAERPRCQFQEGC
jgi:hypothetical protein